MVFDPFLFKDDVSTPLSITMRPATVICRYGYRQTEFCGEKVDWVYEDLVDVRFDHRPERVSKAHFTRQVTKLE